MKLFSINHTPKYDIGQNTWHLYANEPVMIYIHDIRLTNKGWIYYDGENWLLECVLFPSKHALLEVCDLIDEYKGFKHD